MAAGCPEVAVSAAAEAEAVSAGMVAAVSAVAAAAVKDPVLHLSAVGNESFPPELLRDFGFLYVLPCPQPTSESLVLLPACAGSL